MKCYIRVAGLSLQEPEDSPFYNKLIVEGEQAVPNKEGWHGAKLTDNQNALMMLPVGEEPEDRDDWKELVMREQAEGVRFQAWIK